MGPPRPPAARGLSDRALALVTAAVTLPMLWMGYGTDIDITDVVACTGSATELVDAVRRFSPDAVLTDIRMPPGHHMEGIEAAHAIRASSPSTGVVVLSQHADESYALALFADGSAGGTSPSSRRPREPRPPVGSPTAASGCTSPSATRG